MGKEHYVTCDALLPDGTTCGARKEVPDSGLPVGWSTITTVVEWRPPTFERPAPVNPMREGPLRTMMDSVRKMAEKPADVAATQQAIEQALQIARDLANPQTTVPLVALLQQIGAGFRAATGAAFVQHIDQVMADMEAAFEPMVQRAVPLELDVGPVDIAPGVVSVELEPVRTFSRKAIVCDQHPIPPVRVVERHYGHLGCHPGMMTPVDYATVGD